MLVENTVDYAIFMLSPTGEVLTWNAGAQRVKGYEAAEIIGRSFSVFYPEELRAAGHPEHELQIAAAQGRYAEEGWRVRKDGSSFWASVSITALRDATGRLVAFGKVTHDLTARQRANEALVRLQANQQRVLEAIAEGVILYSTEAGGLTVTLANTNAYSLLETDADGLQAWAGGARSLPGLCDTAGHPLRREQLPDMVTAGTGRPVDHVVWGWRDRSGRQRWLNSSSRPVLDDQGVLVGVVFSVLDITERHEARVQLTQTRSRFAALVEHSSDVICILDPDGVVRYASPAYAGIYGEPVEQRLGRPLSERLHPDDRAKVTDVLRELRSIPGEVLTVECRLTQPDGAVRHVELTATNRLADPAVNGIVTNSRDVTERVETAARLTYEAMHDSLTGLANRALLLDRLTQSLGRAKRSRTRCALLFIDLDHFKTINDSFGHAYGDELLTQAAARLARALRPGDTLARLGGDEFVILAEQVAGTGQAQAIAQRATEAISEPITIEGRRIISGCSIGITLSDGDNPEEVLQQADTALYRAKARGRSRWELYDQAMRIGAQRRIDTEARIRHALDTGGVVVHYQPIVSLPTATVVGREALLRLRGPGGELIPPAEVVPTAEDSGLIVPLGLEVLGQACAQQAAWATGGRETASRLSVNVSARQLRSPTLTATVERVLAETGLPPHELCLELTETALIEADQSTRRTVTELAGRGVLIALDDFGTGWSSLAYLRRFPIGALKIDRSFVGGIGPDRNDTEVVKAVIGLGHALDLLVIAEGVETPTQAALLTDLGCDEAQGNLYGRPAPPEHFPPAT